MRRRRHVAVRHGPHVVPRGFVAQLAFEERLPGNRAPGMGIVRLGDRHIIALRTKHIGATRTEPFNFVPRLFAEVLSQIVGRQNNFISDDTGTTRNMLNFKS